MAPTHGYVITLLHDRGIRGWIGWSRVRPGKTIKILEKRVIGLLREAERVEWGTIIIAHRATPVVG